MTREKWLILGVILIGLLSGMFASTYPALYLVLVVAVIVSILGMVEERRQECAAQRERPAPWEPDYRVDIIGRRTFHPDGSVTHHSRARMIPLNGWGVTDTENAFTAPAAPAAIHIQSPAAKSPEDIHREMTHRLKEQA